MLKENSGETKSWKVWEALLILVIVILSVNLLGFLIKIFDLVDNNLDLLVVTSLIQTFLFLGLILYVIFKKYGLSITSLGLSTKNLLSNIRKGIVGGFLIFFLIIFVSIIMATFVTPAAELQPFAEAILGSNDWSQIAILFIFGVIIAPISEEIYFRGFLYPALKKRIGVWLAIILSSSIFGLMHFDLWRFIPITLGGAALAYLYERSGSLFTNITAHSFWNFIMLSLLLWQRSI